jgi:hypothetical protein
MMGFWPISEVAPRFASALQPSTRLLQFTYPSTIEVVIRTGPDRLDVQKAGCRIWPRRRPPRDGREAILGARKTCHAPKGAGA